MPHVLRWLLLSHSVLRHGRTLYYGMMGYMQINSLYCHEPCKGNPMDARSRSSWPSYLSGDLLQCLVIVVQGGVFIAAANERKVQDSNRRRSSCHVTAILWTIVTYKIHTVYVQCVRNCILNTYNVYVICTWAKYIQYIYFFMILY